VGYWLGEAFWNRGIMTSALGAFTPYAFDSFDLIRIFAGVFSTNPASMRVLEKAGYTREGVLRRSVVKDGQVLDQVLYAVTR
jgi:RimJ/RimL family protein N-acetyltransferase